jgi:hypothetical protein
VKDEEIVEEKDGNVEEKSRERSRNERKRRESKTIERRLNSERR